MTPRLSDRERRLVEAAEGVQWCCGLAEDKQHETRCAGHEALDAALSAYKPKRPAP